MLRLKMIDPCSDYEECVAEMRDTKWNRKYINTLLRHFHREVERDQEPGLCLIVEEVCENASVSAQKTGS